MRQLYCAERLSTDFPAAILGFDDEYISDPITVRRTDTAELHSFDCAVLPVIPLDVSGHLNAPCTSSPVSASAVRDMLKDGAVIFTGRSDPCLSEFFPGMEIREYLSREELLLKNAIPTAEGTVQIALEELPVTLSGLKVLVVGMGRCGSLIASLMRSFGADVTAAVRSSSGAAKARIAGAMAVSAENMGSDYGLVINTAPELVFDRSRLSGFRRSTLFIDIASKPGGIDFKAASELGIKVIWALGIPGKSAPVTSGEMIAETVAAMLSERRASL